MSANTSDGARLVSPADREGPEPDGALLAAAREMVQAYRDIEGDVTTGRSDAAFRALEAATPPPYLFTHHPAGQREDAPLDAERSWYDQGWRDGQAVALSPNSLRRTFASVNRELLPTDPGFWETVVQRLRESKP